ncbi:FAD/NAD(P)-binding domain-containing protein, partial [Paxillus ammoniavirescens]
MSPPSHTPFDCPTIDHLNVDKSCIEGVSALEEATKWLSAFATSVSNQDHESTITLFHEHGFWRDILALTWDLRTIRGHSAIKRLLDTRLSLTGLTAFRLVEDPPRGPTVTKPLPRLVFIRFCFEFETGHGKGTAIASLVPLADGLWKAWTLLTRLESLKEFPEQVGNLRDRVVQHENWEDQRRREIDFEDGDPAVVIIGAGHGGLEMAARLKYLGTSTLVIDRNTRIGDNWRTRYKTLCLHDTVWYNRMPYLDFPKTWPVYCPASKLGDWLESYATALDLNVWPSSSVTRTDFIDETRSWRLCINRDGQVRSMTAKHLIFATGFGGGFPKMPDVPGRELYQGVVLHSTEFTSSAEYGGKKVVVVGACNSAHDIALDLCRRGSDVTMIQRSSTYVISAKSAATSLEDRYNEYFPLEFADLLGLALPFATQKHLLRAFTEHMASTTDKNLIEGLERADFRTYLGPDGAGLLPLVFERGGGFYIDTGASQEIIKGTIKVRSSCSVQRFTQGGLELEDGTMVEGDAVIFATGFGDIRDSIREVCGPTVASKVGNVWGLDAEGELQGVWRRTGYPRLWIAMGNLGRSRFHTLHL